MRSGKCRLATKRYRIHKCFAIKRANSQSEEMARTNKYLRYHFDPTERHRYIISILGVLEKAITKIGKKIHNDSPFSLVEKWTSKVELSINCGRFGDALAALDGVGSSPLRRGYSEEFARLAQSIFAKLEWTDELANDQNHDEVFDDLVRVLTQLGRFSEADEYIHRFEDTITGKTARYICLCNMRCYSYWYRKDFDLAKEWGKKGSELKGVGRLDTRHDCLHNLALAQRDSGEVDVALPYFLQGQDLQTVLAAASVDEKRSGEYYGNIGRCLWLKNETQGALSCLRKSALLLESSSDGNTLMNQGWAAFWIGEILERQEQFELAILAFRRASVKWRSVAPPLCDSAQDAILRLQRTRNASAHHVPTDAEVDRIFLRWLGSK